MTGTGSDPFLTRNSNKREGAGERTTYEPKMIIIFIILLLATTTTASVSSSATLGSHRCSVAVAATTTRTRRTAAFCRPAPRRRRLYHRRHCQEEETSRRRSSLDAAANSNNSGNSGSESLSDDDNNKKRRKSRFFSIPVLPPLPGKPSLFPCGEMILEPPITETQWLSIEEAIHVHHEQFNNSEKKKKNGGDNDSINNQSNENSNSGRSAASITAAPLIAVMDDYTVPGEKDEPMMLAPDGQESTTGRYATLAAVVGISSPPVAGSGSDNAGESLDMSDQGSFMASLQKIGSRSTLPTDCRIRLMGIGRAALQNFYYQIPSRVQQDMMDDKGYLILEEDDDEIDDDGTMTRPTSRDTTKIVTADFLLIKDQTQRSSQFLSGGDRDALERRRSFLVSRSGQKSAFASPVHALAKMSSLTNRINRWHQERKQLVAGLKAADARLKFAAAASGAAAAVQNDDNENNSGDKFLDDHDGLGMVVSQRREYEQEEEEEREATQAAVEQILDMFPKSSLQEKKNKKNQSMNTEDNSNESIARLLQMENYGMGFTAISVSTIVPDFTDVQLERLQPYYSPEVRVR